MTKQTSHALTFSQLETLVTAFPGMVSVIDREYNILWVDPKFAGDTGASGVERVIGEHCYTARSGRVDPCPECDVRQVFETGEAYTAAYSSDVKTCDRPAMQTHTVPLKNEDGSVWGAAMFFLDCSVLPPAEAALRQSQESLEEAQRRAGLGSWDLDIAAGRGFWSKEMFRIFYRDPALGVPGFEEFVGLIHPDDRAELIEVTRRAAEHGESANRDYRTNPACGPMRFIDTTFSCERDDAGHVVKLVGSVLDVTTRKQAEEKLKHFKSAVECSSHAVGMSTPDGHHWYQNRAFDTLFGTEVGTDPPATLYVDEALGRTVFSTIMSGGEWSGELEMYGKDKQRLDVFLRAYAIKNDRDEIIGLVGVHTDISDEKRAAAERQKWEQQAGQIQKLESLGVLAGGIAHDFNNLLGGIFGYIELAAGNLPAASPAAGYLGKALGTIDRARALTRQLLTFSKGGVPRKEVGPLFPFVRETAEFALSGSNLSLSVESPAELAWCDFDKHQIGQVIDNLVINALQAMPKGGQIVISAKNVQLGEGELPLVSAGNYVRISVKDTGVGIPEDMLSNIFDPFFTTKQLGSGLGLATTYSIIKKHGGCITVDSVPGKGSTFHVYLPASAERGPLQTESLRQPPTGSGRILIMDDEPVIRETTAALCESLGYDTVCTKEGRETLSFLKQEVDEGRSVQALILDLTIPGGMGGKEAVSEIRKLIPDAIVFVSSGYADDPIMADPSAHGFTAGIPKPFRRDQLAELLAAYLPK